MMIDELNKKLNEVISMFGKETVREVLITVQTVGDSEVVYCKYEDTRMNQHAACLAKLYFEE